MTDQRLNKPFVLWLIVGLAALLAGLIADGLGVPAGWLVGPLLAALVLTVRFGIRTPIPDSLMVLAQAVIGIAVSASFNPQSLGTFVSHWPLMLAVAGATLVLSIASGLILVRTSALDPATATLGVLPGGASGIVAMSDDLHADARIVAFMQYVRLVLVVLTVSLFTPAVLAMLGSSESALPAAVPVTQSPTLVEYLITLVVAVSSAWAGQRIGMPAGAIVGPVLAGATIGAFGVAHGTWPPGVLEVAYALLGLQVGGRFDTASLRRVREVALAVLIFVIALMVGCAILGWALVWLAGVDPLSAYLATTPGGVQAVAAVALDVRADVALVLTLQIVRILVVVVLGPPIIRWLNRVR